MGLENSLLGKKTEYKNIYDSTLLFPIERSKQREQLGSGSDDLPFFGVDIWNAYEISWLNPKGKPNIAIGEFYIPADSKNIIESKSLKMYLNSFNNTKLESRDQVAEILKKDLTRAVGKAVEIVLLPLQTIKSDLCEFGVLKGVNIDHLDIQCDHYNEVNNNLIKYCDEYIEETINSDLLKSNCLVTGQPDWGSVSIEYKGKRIDHASMLEYIISFRNHNEFHEHCVERIFMDIYNIIQPKYLAVYARYTRRGGLDISPYRTTDRVFNNPSNKRLIRQ